MPTHEAGAIDFRLDADGRGFAIPSQRFQDF